MIKIGLFILPIFVGVSGFACNPQFDVSQNSTPKRSEIASVNKTPTELSKLPEECKQLFAVATIASIKNDLEDARQKYQNAFESGCDNTDSRLDFGSVLRRLGQSDDAAEQYRIVTRQNYKNWSAHWALAQVLVIDLGKYEDGLEEIQTSKELDDLGDLGYTYDYFLGRAFEGLNKKDEALRYYMSFARNQSKVRKGDPNLADANQRILLLQNRAHVLKTDKQ